MPDLALWSTWVLPVVVWSGWAFAAVLVVFQARKFWRRVARPARPGFDAYQPPAAVIVPFKGIDADLPQHVRGLLTQDYPDYRPVFVLESKADPAYRVLRDELARHPDAPRVDFVFAGVAPPDTGQKVHNQLAALSHIEANLPDAEVWVFGDSDAAPGPHWVQQLVGPHGHAERVGVTTGYRWLFPRLRAQRPRLGGVFASVINSGVATMLGHAPLTQAWGGSMAVRADFARQHGLAGHFRGALSDDYQMTRMCRETDRRVYFVHRCLVPSPVDMSMRELFTFARRQYTITRVHDPRLYWKAVGVVTLYVVSSLTATAALVGGIVTGYWLLAGLALHAMLWVGIANQMRAMYRRRAVKAAFGPDGRRYLRHTLFVDRWLTWLVMTVNLALLLSAAVGRTIAWRGVRYRMNAPQSVQRLDPRPAAAAVPPPRRERPGTSA